MNIVVSDPKSRKAFSINTDAPVFVGKKIGDIVELDGLGLSGYKAVITGGSDKDGFPMKPGLPGSARRRIVIGASVGHRPEERNVKKRKTVRGCVISEEIQQVNLKIVEYGKEPLDKFFKKKEEEKTQEG